MPPLCTENAGDHAPKHEVATTDAYTNPDTTLTCALVVLRLHGQPVAGTIAHEEDLIICGGGYTVSALVRCPA